MKTKHTPGPWVLEPGPRGDEKNLWRVGNSAETPIFSILCGRKEARENARLIAAAPDLLQACKLAYAWVEEMGCEHPDDRPRSECHVCMLRSAIAKAEKGTQ